MGRQGAVVERRIARRRVDLEIVRRQPRTRLRSACFAGVEPEARPRAFKPLGWGPKGRGALPPRGPEGSDLRVGGANRNRANPQCPTGSHESFQSVGEFERVRNSAAPKLRLTAELEPTKGAAVGPSRCAVKPWRPSQPNGARPTEVDHRARAGLCDVESAEIAIRTGWYRLPRP